MGLITRHFYEFGPFRLDPAEHLLLRGERSVALAPKAFELLVFLVKNQGRLVSKDQIMQAVWPGSFVEEANLTVWISVLRKTLGDSEGTLQFIETVPKKGYRFTAPVREVVPQLSSTPDSYPPASAEEVRPGEDNHSPAGAVLLAAGTEAMHRRPGSGAEGASADNAGPGLRGRYIVAAAGLLLSLALLGYFGLRQPATTRLSPDPRTLAVLPFQNLQQDKQSDFLSLSLADAIITKLDYVSSLTVRPSTAVEKYRSQEIDIQKIGVDLKVNTLLTGSFIHDGDKLRITYQLIDVKSDRLLGRGSMDLKYDDLLEVQDNFAQRIIQDLELKLSPSEAARIKPDAPVNPLAYEYYLKGLDLHGQHNFPLAIKMFEKSTEIDPNYAPAWAYLGASYNSDAAFELSGREQYNRARAAYERALAVQPSQLDAQIFFANLLVDTGKVEQAVPLLRDAIHTNPNQAAAHWELGYAYRFAGMLNESAAECERALQIDPQVKANGSVLNTYLYLGQYHKFLSSLPEVGGSSFFLFYRGLGEYYQKDLERAARDFDRSYEADPSLYARIGKALSDSIAHRNAEGLAILRSLEQKIEERGVGDPEATYKIAQAYSMLGDKASALRMLKQSVEGGFFCYPYLATDPLLDGLRAQPQFAEILNVCQKRHEAFRARFF